MARAAPTDLASAVASFLEELDKLVEARDKPALGKAMKKLVTLHNVSKAKKDRALLAKAAGKILCNKDLGSARGEAADALGRLNDESTAYKQLSKALPSVKDRTVDAVGLRVIDALGYLAPDAGVASLLTLAQKSADPNAATHAVRALGGYGYSKHRQRILAALIRRAKTKAPGQSRPGDRGVSLDVRRLWQALSGEIVNALNSLTGRRVPDIEGWSALHREHKKKLSKLFTRPR